jgi:hypothetical protein
MIDSFTKYSPTHNFEQICEGLKKGIFKVKSYYPQKKIKYTAYLKSLYIESILLDVPTVPIYLILTSEKPVEYLVMGGLEKLEAIEAFAKDAFELEGLSILPNLNGATYSNLPPEQKSRLDYSLVKFEVIDIEPDSRELDSTKQILIEIFNRLNYPKRHDDSNKKIHA